MGNRWGERSFLQRGDALVADDAVITGDVMLGEGTNIWFGCVLRGDDAAISIGALTNIQDHCVVHADPDAPNHIGEACTVGHRAILHGLGTGDRCLIGMGSILLGGSFIGEESLIAAGALVREGMDVPPRSLVVGVPGRIVCELSAEEAADSLGRAERYRERALEYLPDA